MGERMAREGRVIAGDAEEYCGESMARWTVLHHGERELGQAVTQLEGKFFCECHDFVLRALACSHICAVQAHQAIASTAADPLSRWKSTLHYVLSPHYLQKTNKGALPGLPGDLYKPYTPGRVPTRHRRLDAGTRVLINVNQDELQVATVVSRAQDTCDVALGDGAGVCRVSQRSIVDWIARGPTHKPKYAWETARDGATVPAAARKQAPQLGRSAGTSSKPRKKACVSQSTVRRDANANANEADRPRPFKWGLTVGDVERSNTCRYDAVLVVAMHAMANSPCIRAFIDHGKPLDARLAQLDDVGRLFWQGSIAEPNSLRIPQARRAACLATA